VARLLLPAAAVEDAPRRQVVGEQIAAVSEEEVVDPSLGVEDRGRQRLARRGRAQVLRAAAARVVAEHHPALVVRDRRLLAAVGPEVEPAILSLLDARVDLPRVVALLRLGERVANVEDLLYRPCLRIVLVKEGKPLRAQMVPQPEVILPVAGDAAVAPAAPEGLPPSVRQSGEAMHRYPRRRLRDGKGAVISRKS
jgi:hypothetical protein